MNYNLYSGWTCACNRTLKGASRLIDSLQRQPQILLLNIFLVLICLLDCSSYGCTRLFQKVTNSEFRKDFYGNGKLQKWILGHLFFPITPAAWTTLSKVSFVWNCHANHKVMAGKESRKSNFHEWPGRSRVGYFHFFLFIPNWAPFPFFNLNL